MDGGDAVIEVDVGGNAAPLTLENHQQICKDHSMEPFFWAQCDDPSTEGRLWVAAGFSTEGQYFVVRNRAGGVCVYTNNLERATYEACKNGQSEIENTDLAYSAVDGDCTIKAFYLVDLEKELTYGMKFELKTTTSTTLDSFVFPVLKQ